MLKFRNPAMAGQLGLRSGSGHELSREMAVFVAISGKPRVVICWEVGLGLNNF